MANIATQRIKREFKEVVKSEEVARCAIKIELVNDSWSELRGEIAGPPDTPYEGGNFQLEILVPETYPFNPPKLNGRFRSASSPKSGIPTFPPSLEPFVSIS